MAERTEARLGPATRVAVRLIVGAALVIAAMWSAGTIVEAFLGPPATPGLDRPVVRLLAARREPALTSAMRTITFFGGIVFVAGAFVAVAGLAYVRARNVRLPLFVLASAAGGLALDDIVKFLVNRPRPDIAPVVEALGSAFPSGHATAATALFAAFAYVLTRRLDRRTAVWVWVPAMLASALVALSRVYLGVHWPTDVLAGMALGGSWVAVARGATDRFAEE